MIITHEVAEGRIYTMHDEPEHRWVRITSSSLFQAFEGSSPLEKAFAGATGDGTRRQEVLGGHPRGRLNALRKQANEQVLVESEDGSGLLCRGRSRPYG
jgi:hypothetical protein